MLNIIVNALVIAMVATPWLFVAAMAVKQQFGSDVI
jgi:hypothetical protein